MDLSTYVLTEASVISFVQGKFLWFVTYLTVMLCAYLYTWPLSQGALVWFFCVGTNSKGEGKLCYWKSYLLTNCYITGDVNQHNSYTPPQIIIRFVTVHVYVLLVRRVIRDWMIRKHEEYWQSIHGQRHAKGFLQRPSAKTVGELLNLSRNQLTIMTGLLTGHCHLIGHLFKLGLEESWVWQHQTGIWNGLICSLWL
jgi:hypothetical protein